MNIFESVAESCIIMYIALKFSTDVMLRLKGRLVPVILTQQS